MASVNARLRPLAQFAVCCIETASPSRSSGSTAPGQSCRPYVVTDMTIASRLWRKLTWHLRIFFPGILVQLYLAKYVLPMPWILIAVWGFNVILNHTVLQFVLQSELRTMSRTPTRLPLRNFYWDIARRHSEADFLVRFVFTLMFLAFGVAVAFGAVNMDSERSTVIDGILMIVWFGWIAAVFIYLFILKREQKREMLKMMRRHRDQARRTMRRLTGI
jgi:hypothetical protein